jgi:hypothetical protein
MAGKKDIEAASAYVRLYVKGGDLAKGLRSAGDQLKSFGGSVSAAAAKLGLAAAAMGAPLVASIKAYVDLGSELDDVSQRTGMAVESLSALKFAAELAGSDFGTLEKAIRKAGISSMEEFEQMADTIASVADPGERALVAMKLLGKAGAALVPMMAGGSAGVRALVGQAKALGQVVSADQAAKAASLGDAFEIVGKMVTMLAFSVGSALEPAISSLAGWMTGMISIAQKWVENNSETVKVFAAVTAGVLAAAGALAVLGGSATVLGVALIGVSTAISTIGAVLAVVLSPLGVAVGLIASLGAYVVYASGGLTNLGNMFGEMASIAGEAWGGVLAAIAGGDLELAGSIAVDALSILFQTAISGMADTWYQFVDWVSSGTFAVDMFNNLSSYFIKALNGLYILWDRFIEFLGGESAESKMAARVQQMQQGLAKAEEFKQITEFNAAGAKNKQPRELSEEELQKRKRLAENIVGLQSKVAQAKELPTLAMPEIQQLGSVNLGQNSLKSITAKTKETITTGGVFRAAGIRSIGGNTAAERTARATEETAKNTKKISATFTP